MQLYWYITISRIKLQLTGYMTNVMYKITFVDIKLNTCEFKFFSFNILEQIDIFISLVFL